MDENLQEPLGKLYKRIQEEYKTRQETIQDRANRFIQNPQGELKQQKEHNAIISKILNIMVKRNNDGMKLEKLGKIAKAITLYEDNVKDEFFGTYPYERLMILYRKNKMYSDEIRIINKAIELFSNTRGYEKDVLKFKSRLIKSTLLLNKKNNP